MTAPWAVLQRKVFVLARSVRWFLFAVLFALLFVVFIFELTLLIYFLCGLFFAVYSCHLLFNKMEWTNELVLQLIEKYRIRPVLWDSRNKYFKIKSKKEKAWSEISKEMNTSNVEIKKKMMSLLASFRRERMKIEHKPSGSGVDDVYKTKWFAFKSFLFLLNKNKPDDAEDTEEIEQVQEESVIVDNTNEVADIVDDTNQNISSSSNFALLQELPSKKQRRDEEGEIFMNVCKSLRSMAEQKQQRDGCSIYGEYIADKLRSYDKYTVAVVQHKFNNILFEADMGHFAKNVQVEALAPSPMCSVASHYEDIEIVQHSASE